MRIVKHETINFVYMIISKSTYVIYCPGLMNIKHQHLFMFNQMTTIVITDIIIRSLVVLRSQRCVVIIMQFYGIINR